MRECAMSILNKNDQFTSMVEPELTFINQRWAEITARLKVSKVSIRVVSVTEYMKDK
ncbi:hypothetical protein DPMN_045868 [Dreissena polymorpha]|uniref:Uncharacterized protein n=1 Tax=Dreissena polymorpha TaxID=45954 RepID=A0A9D4D6V9_DREPO|nr:hypothetical protein DPMN_045868 [Dreissena polymorpha]